MKTDPCWKGYEMVGTKQKGKKTVPNCVQKKSVGRKQKIDGYLMQNKKVVRGKGKKGGFLFGLINSGIQSAASAIRPLIPTSKPTTMPSAAKPIRRFKDEYNTTDKMPPPGSDMYAKFQRIMTDTNMSKENKDIELDNLIGSGMEFDDLMIGAGMAKPGFKMTEFLKSGLSKTGNFASTLGSALATSAVGTVGSLGIMELYKRWQEKKEQEKERQRQQEMSGGAKPSYSKNFSQVKVDKYGTLADTPDFNIKNPNFDANVDAAQKSIIDDLNNRTKITKGTISSKKPKSEDKTPLLSDYDGYEGADFDMTSFENPQYVPPALKKPKKIRSKRAAKALAIGIPSAIGIASLGALIGTQANKKNSDEKKEEEEEQKPKPSIMYGNGKDFERLAPKDKLRNTQNPTIANRPSPQHLKAIKKSLGDLKSNRKVRFQIPEQMMDIAESVEPSTSGFQMPATSNYQPLPQQFTQRRSRPPSLAESFVNSLYGTSSRASTPTQSYGTEPEIANLNLSSSSNRSIPVNFQPSQSLLQQQNEMLQNLSTQIASPEPVTSRSVLSERLASPRLAVEERNVITEPTIPSNSMAFRILLNSANQIQVPSQQPTQPTPPRQPVVSIIPRPTTSRQAQSFVPYQVNSSADLTEARREILNRYQDIVEGNQTVNLTEARREALNRYPDIVKGNQTISFVPGQTQYNYLADQLNLRNLGNMRNQNSFLRAIPQGDPRYENAQRILRAIGQSNSQAISPPPGFDNYESLSRPAQSPIPEELRRPQTPAPSYRAPSVASSFVDSLYPSSRSSTPAPAYTPRGPERARSATPYLDYTPTVEAVELPTGEPATSRLGRMRYAVTDAINSAMYGRNRNPLALQRADVLTQRLPTPGPDEPSDIQRALMNIDQSNTPVVSNEIAKESQKREERRRQLAQLDGQMATAKDTVETLADVAVLTAQRGEKLSNLEPQAKRLAEFSKEYKTTTNEMIKDNPYGVAIYDRYNPFNYIPNFANIAKPVKYAAIGIPAALGAAALGTYLIKRRRDKKKRRG